MIKLPEIDINNINFSLKSILETKTHIQQVQFALNAAKDVQHLHNNEQANLCIDLIEKYLDNVDNVKINVDNVKININDHTASSYVSIRSINYVIRNSFGAITSAASGFAWVNYNDAWSNSNLYKNIISFYINEIGLTLYPHSNLTKHFNLNNQKEFELALDFVQEHRHNDLIVEENSLKFYNFLKANSISELVDKIFGNEFYKKQVIRILERMLND